jgi:hypothetical protein
MNLTGQSVYQKGQKRKPSKKATVSHLAPLIARARAKGSERQYLDWLKTQPSALSGKFSWDDGTPFCEPAHWRTSKHAGTGQKPEFLAIPLNHSEHQFQHQEGQIVIGTRDWWQDQCVIHIERWIAS